MKLLSNDPSFIQIDIDAQSVPSLRKFLTYHDKSVDFEIRNLKKQVWFQRKDPTAFAQRLQELKAEQTKTLLFETEDGTLSTYSGLKDLLLQRFPGSTYENRVVYPSPKTIAWKTVPPALYEHQTEALDKLLTDYESEGTPRAVSIGTGGGKSFIILNTIKRLGLKAIVMAPSISIASQLYDDFLKYLGPKYVGFYGNGKKQLGKLVTVGIAASLTKIEPGSEAYKDLSQAKVFIADESHLTPAATLLRVALGLAKDAPYRFFFSATQVRNDGSELVLKGVIGRIVMTLPVKDLVEKGILAEPVTTMIQVPSLSSYISDDAQKMTRTHLYENPNVLKQVGAIVNGVIKAYGQQVLILIDEVEQFNKLLPYFRYEAKFAHGTLTKETKIKVPVQYHKDDPKDLVARFNNLEFPILVGTSCISTGTDIRSVETVVNLVGGCSPIAVPQGVGRSTRKYTFPDGRVKQKCNIIDFIPCIVNQAKGVDDYSNDMADWSMVKRHAMARKRMYYDIYPNVEIKK